jgi:MYXO-CTERM domain-containing protein
MIHMRSALVVAFLGLPAIAHAHIHMMDPASRAIDAQGNPQKLQHCGDPTVTRGTKIKTYKPGETITVTWQETINHPGWYRISFQPNGEMFRIPPASNGQAIVNMVAQASNMPTEDLTGMMDPGGTGSMILKDRIPDGTLTTTVTLPNMECTNCTLQLIQVMINNPPYTVAADSNDIYFNCADLVLANDAPDAGVQPENPDASVDPGNNPGMDLGKVSGGCSTGGGAGLPALFALAGLVVVRRRRRRA